MKLISCYIENFGNIKQRSFDFERGLTSVCEHNGYGKTTLASFLKAMFYGLKQTRKNDKELGERERFYPFEGGKFGGNIVFEKSGNVYKIERFFDKKSITGDIYTVYENGDVTATGSGACDDFGKDYFGIDEQSFLRTVFLNSADTESGATGDISRMLNGFVDDADFDGAKKILEKQQKEYKAARGRGGKIDEKHDKITELKINIDNKEKINGELARKYADRRALAKTVADLEEKQNSSRDTNLVLQKWQTLDGFTADAEAERKKLGAIEEKYPGGFPDAEEATELKEKVEALNLANERQISARLSIEKAQRIEELSARFPDGVPSDEEISSINDICASIIRLDAEIANCESFVRGGNESKFPAGIPDGEELKKYNDKLISLRETKNQPVNSRKTDKKIPLIFVIFALILIGGGIGLLFVHTIAGCAVLGIGAVCVLVAIFTYFKGQINGMKGAVPSAESSETENEIKIFLARYGYYSDSGVEVDFNNLIRDIETYKTELSEREKYEKLLAEKRAEADEAKGKVASFLTGYGLTGENAQADLTRLSAMVTEYTALKAEKEDVSKRSQAGRSQIEEYARAVRSILYRYAIEESENFGAQATEIERDRTEADRLKENIARLEKRALDYKTENGLEERPAGAEDTQSIDSELSKKRDELSLLDREISDDEASVERLAELKEELETAKEEEEALKKKYDILCRASAFLEKAEQNLKDRYISPVRKSFLNYSGILEEVLGEKVAFDKDFKVKFERGGELRSDSHLSAGQKSLCTLCLRLALIDNMYKNEKPFIIMDDPFVHLDGVHLERAMKLLKELAKNKQIIYFCCHESRQV